MGTRFKLRVCTWNVGNAQPPSDLSPWLGIGADDYDIIAVGAQEANYGTEKAPSPTSVASPYSNVESFTPSTNQDSSFSTPSPNMTDFTNVTAPRRLRKLSKAVRSATGTWKSRSSSKLQRLKSKKKHLDTTETEQQSEWPPEVVDEDQDAGSTSEEEVGKSSRNMMFPLAVHHSTGNLKNRIRKSRAGDRLEHASKEQKEKFIPGSPLKELDESLLEKRKEDSDRSIDPSPDDSGPFITETEVVVDYESLGYPEEDEDSDSSTLVEEEGGQKKSILRTMRKSQQWLSRKNTLPAPSILRMSSVRPGIGDGGAEDGPSQSGMTCKKFSHAVEQTMPAELELIAKHHMMEIKLLLFVHSRHKSRVVKTETVAEATGIGNVVGNKGGVAVKLTLDDTTFCFICSHLAAHEGAKFLQQRNADVVEIMRNVERNKVHGLPAMHQFNHVFWMGDLNYRLDLKRVIPAAVTWSHQERWSYVIDLISNRRYEDLAGLDELLQEIELEHVFAGFAEGRIRFPPTFKVDRGKGYSSYQVLRVPSYCDRILWHSLPMHKNHIRLKEYNSVVDMDTSDHKPVYAVFDLVIPKAMVRIPLPAPRNTLKCTLDFTSLRVYGLYEKRNETEEAGVKYEILEDGALGFVGEDDGSDVRVGVGGGGSHTRRVVHADFHGGGLFVRERGFRMEVPVRGAGRECRYEELPKIALRPVKSLGDLRYKYVTVVFTRLGSRQGSSCVVPVAKLVSVPGRHFGRFEVDVIKYGTAVAKAEIRVELVVSLETWIDGRNRKVKVGK